MRKMRIKKKKIRWKKKEKKKYLNKKRWKL